jgi:TetR/AcrR family transcriptional repressor of nem operon
MARPREFDREEALERATGVFWAKGYASTSTDDLLTAMGIGRQSLYNAFQDKRALYLEALIQMTMQSIQLAARGGIDAISLRAQARFVVERLKSR